MSRVRRLLLGLGLAIALLSLMPWTPVYALTDSYVGRVFRNFYETHDGIRLLGVPQTGIRKVNGYPAQYFEKGRLEDHRLIRKTRLGG